MGLAAEKQPQPAQPRPLLHATQFPASDYVKVRLPGWLRAYCALPRVLVVILYISPVRYHSGVIPPGSITGRDQSDRCQHTAGYGSRCIPWWLSRLLPSPSPIASTLLSWKPILKINHTLLGKYAYISNGGPLLRRLLPPFPMPTTRAGQTLQNSFETDSPFPGFFLYM